MVNLYDIQFSPSQTVSRKAAKGIMAPNRRALLHLYSRVPFLIRRTEQLATTIQASLSDSGLTLGQCHFLAILDSLGTVSQVDIAELSGYDTSTTSLVLENLAERGHVRRKTDPLDRRRKLVAISAAGRRSLTAAVPGLEETNRLLIEPVSSATQELVALLGKVTQTPQYGPAWIGAADRTDRIDITALEPLFASPVFLVRRTLQVLDAISSEELTGIDATIRQFAAMLLIVNHPGICAADLARLGGFEASNICFLLRLLGRKGFVERHAPSSGGRTGYRVTAAGLTIVEQTEPAMRRTERRLLKALTAAEADRLRQLLAQIVVGAAGGRFSTMPYLQEVISDQHWLIGPTRHRHAPIETASRASSRDPVSSVGSAQGTMKLRFAHRGVLQLIRCAELRIAPHIDRLLASYGLNVIQSLLIDILAERSRANSADLAHAMGVTADCLSRTVRDLEAKGLVAQRRDGAESSRRPVSITAAGRRLRDTVGRSLSRLEDDVLADLSKRERNDLRRGLIALLSHSDKRLL